MADNTIRYDQLTTKSEILLTDLMALSDSNGILYKKDLQSFVNFFSTTSGLDFKGSISAGTYATKDAGWYIANETGDYIMGTTTLTVVSETLAIIIVESVIDDSNLVSIPLSITIDTTVIEDSTDAVSGGAVFNNDFATEKANVSQINSDYNFDGFVKDETNATATLNNVYTAISDFTFFGLSVVKGDRIVRNASSWAILPKQLTYDSISETATKKNFTAENQTSLADNIDKNFAIERANILQINPDYIFQGFLKSGDSVTNTTNFVYTAIEDFTFLGVLPVVKGDRLVRGVSWSILPKRLQFDEVPTLASENAPTSGSTFDNDFATEKANILQINSDYNFQGFVKTGTSVTPTTNNVYTAVEDFDFVGALPVVKGDRILRGAASWTILPKLMSLDSITETSTKKILTSAERTSIATIPTNATNITANTKTINQNLQGSVRGNFDFVDADSVYFSKVVEINNAIHFVKLVGDINETYDYSIAVYTNNSTQRRIRIFQHDGTTRTEVCSLVIAQSSPKLDVENVFVQEKSASGIKAYIVIDWGKLIDVDYVAMYEDTWKFSKSTFLRQAPRKTENLFNDFFNFNLQSWTKSGETITSTDTGWSRPAYYDVNLNEDHFSFSAIIKPTNSGNFEIGIGKRASVSGTAFTLVKSGTDYFLKSYMLSDQNAPTEIVAERVTLATELVQNGEYFVKMTKTLADPNTTVLYLQYPDGEEVTKSFTTAPGSSIGQSWGYPAIYAITGVCEATKPCFTMNYKRDCKLIAFGDSFLEGNSIMYTKEDRYIKLLSDDLGINEVPILAKGGESTSSVLNRIYQQIDWYSEAKYCLIALATNDTVFSTYQTNILSFIAYLKSYGIIPILVTCTYRSDSPNASFQASVNSWVRSSGEKYVDMSLAVTEVGDETAWRSGFLLADGVHPSITGHEYMYRRIKRDAQYLFKD